MWSIYNKKKNIYELQVMLRELSKKYRGIRLINPDALFGPVTKGAVMDVQKLFGLEPTGEVDYDTWATIVKYYDAIQNKMIEKIIME